MLSHDLYLSFSNGSGSNIYACNGASYEISFGSLSLVSVSLYHDSSSAIVGEDMSCIAHA